MATPDHTVLARLSGLPDYLFVHLRNGPLDAADVDEASPPAIGPIIASIDQVKAVITCLLGDSDAFQEAVYEGLDVRVTQWPLVPMVYGGLLVASHLLDQYTECLQARDA